ncbi:glycerophosphoryl diester phosphodiesterase membrane domain-containing protein [Streptomyces sennicomposti]|uniref:glycerophosphoryl diester phosphodiesterase membrane domain-containing protein n=1 Tax=Streptomyces sennicomposti TaxID=2873384 RepID=UPI001CA634A6|nr:glycerophosphoryl diester phosphodiesterase membrane domain-containing protein [Streptomyces sennicomposti]MBY8868907.1 glycerophosphoryl diester phosphodiesterase membrane domain-containing protein [Streptomyces sennicomposti]
MNDTPGWSSPGSAPSDDQRPGTPGPGDAADRPAPAQPADRPGTPPAGPGVKWSKEQPPAGQWSAPTGAPADRSPGATGQTPPPPPPPPPGWGTPPAGGPGGYGPPPGPGGYGGYGAPGGYGGGPGGWGGPGYGGYGAWGGGWGGPPPAAKPGVIPLRPLGVGEILDGAVSTMRTYWRTVLGISLAVAVVTQIVLILVQRLVLGSAGTDALDDPNASTGELLRAMRSAALGSGVVFLVTLVGTVLATALLTTVTSRAVLGKQITVAEAWRDSRPRILKLFGLILLLLLIAVGVFAVGLVPGVLVSVSGSPVAGTGIAVLGVLGSGVVAIWLAVRFSLASPALMLEKQGVKKAMSRSAKLVKGAWWRVFGIQLLAALIAGIVSAVIAIPFGLVGAAMTDEGVSGVLNGTGNISWTYLLVSGVGAVIGSMIKFPISAGVTVLLYIDQRIRREALDLELARAAGVQNPGAPASGS